MKQYIKTLALSMTVALLFNSCSENGIDDNGGGNYKPADYYVKGKVEKGPFISGSTINLQPMDAQLQPNGSTFSTTITDHLGNFSFGQKTLEAPFAQLTANGYFFNEVKGELSNGTLSLRAIVNVADASTVNVNILTHLKYSRIQNLVENDHKSFDEANKQAQKELMKAFGLEKLANSDAANYSISSGTEEAAALIAISSMILAERSEAQVTEYLAKLSKEFGEMGAFSVESKEQMKNDRNSILDGFSKIEDNVKNRFEELGQTVNVLPLEYYFDWDGDGVAGNEIADPNNPPTLSATEISVPKEGGEYTINIDSKVQLYLDYHNLNGDVPSSSITTEEFYNNIYDHQSTTGSIEKILNGNVLKIKVSATGQKSVSRTEIPLYDYAGNTVATVTLTQEGDPALPAPKLGVDAQTVVVGAFSNLAYAMTFMSNSVNGYGNYSGCTLQAPLSANSTTINYLWSYYYKAINYMLNLDRVDKEREAAFTAPISLFNAIAYYNMVTVWGGIPYLKESPTVDSSYNIFRTSEADVLNDLQTLLESIIPELEEKKNSYDTNINDVFFCSKDVARILLADIYMYRNNYSKAKPYLEKVISNGYYNLNSNDVIMAYQYSVITRASSTNEYVPLFTLSDVTLSLAECEYKLGNTNVAWQNAKKVADAKQTFSNITAPEGLLQYVSQIRKVSMSTTIGRFAFLKRTGLAKQELNLQDYQLLFPIPANEIMYSSNMTQNPGY